MRELADVKAREATLYSSLSDQRKHLLSTVSTHTQKSTRLRQELEKIDSLPEAKRASELREQTATVADEIAVLRQKLRELEKSHKGMQAELAGLDNIVEARASSYKAALEAVSRKTVAFLREQGGQQKSPETAAEAWGLEAEAYSEKREEAEREGGALREGMELWEGAMRRVCGFEEGLQKRIDAGGGREAMEGLKEEIEKVAEELEDMVETAERRGWKLMVVAVGAELQAFREAGEVLKNQLRLVGGSRDSAGGKVEEHGFGNVNDDGDRSRFLGDDGGI